MNLSKAGGNLGIIVALCLFSAIILFHELGHFLLAKKNGIGVTEFALGMGPNIFSFKKGETEYCLKALPFGGLCAMVGEDTDEVGENSFNSKNVWQRISVVAAGPIFNFILAFMFAVILVGFVGYDTPVVYKTEAGGPAYEAGIMAGDVIKLVDGKRIYMFKEFRTQVMMNSDGNPMTIVLERDGEEFTTVVYPELTESGTYKMQIYGGAYADTGFFETIKYGVLEIRYWITTTVKSLGMMFSGGVSADDVSGPVGIVTMIDDTYQEASTYGVMNVLLNMMNIGIMLSANLGVMNLLPIPALDGGRLVFLVLEALRGKPISPEKEGWVHTAGFALLMGLMLFILYNDLVKLFV